jgi:GT2 family glycosyltransferase
MQTSVSEVYGADKMVDIILVAYNATKALHDCIRSIQRNTSNIQYQITVVDNSDAPTAVDESVRVIRPGRNLGFSAAANLAIRTTNAEFIALVDDDVLVRQKWLERLLDSLQAEPQAAIAGPKVAYPGRRLFAADLRYGPMRNPAFGELDRGQRDYIKTADSIVGACWVMKRSLVDAIGYFDESFFPCQYEDSDYCIRARLNGFTIVYNGTAVVTHRALFRADGKSLANRERFLRKWEAVLPQFPRTDSHFADRLISEAILHLRNRRYNCAMANIRQVQKSDSRLNEPILEAICEMEIGDAQQAEAQFQEILRIRPGHSLAMNYLARIRSRVGHNPVMPAKAALDEFVFRRSVQNAAR